MRAKQMKSGISARSVKKVAKKAIRKTESALALVTDRARDGARVAKHARASLKGLSSRTKRFVKSNPVRVLLGASAIGFVLAKLKHLA
jgi:ElaB/YqjD/DUF883 family membrane-anchored ribosome-binding protein